MDKVAIFGLGKNYINHKKEYESNYEIVCLVDNNLERKGAKPVSYLRDIQYDIVIITPSYYKDMYEQLLDMGIPKDKIQIESLSSDSYRNEIMGNSFWGQHADDLIIEAIFARIGIDKLSYIDLGCNHPVDCSNTIAFYKNGCRGINIDANPDIIQLVRDVKCDDINLNVGIAAKEGVLKFYMVNEYSGCNSFSVDEINSWGGKVTKTIDVPVVTLKSIIDEYCPDGFPDFLDCDIEGLDYEVLESYDFLKDGPKVICVEVREKEIIKFDDMLDGKGYYRFCRIGENNIYVQKKYSNVVSHMTLE